MKNEIILLKDVLTMIFLIRDEKVILDRDLAKLYGVDTKVLKQAVKRNIERFPSDFMFVLNNQEFTDWRSQFVTSNSEKMGLRHPPMAFTEQGVAMLSSVLNSKVAIQVNIQIIRAFVQLRHEPANYDKIEAKIKKIELEIQEQLSEHQDKIQLILETIEQLFTPRPFERRRIGYRRSENAE
jgi:phage regulator Rha-like protein